MYVLLFNAILRLNANLIYEIVNVLNLSQNFTENVLLKIGKVAASDLF